MRVIVFRKYELNKIFNISLKFKIELIDSVWTLKWSITENIHYMKH